MRILKIIPDTVADGPGLRTSIYFAGCKVHCEGCHNPESWDMYGGYEISSEELFNKVHIYGNKKVTLTGGNPLDQEDLESLMHLCQTFKINNYNIWLYSGYTWEDIQKLLDVYHQFNSKKYIELTSILNNCDVIVDGPFKKALRDTTLKYRGSSNQRIIDVKKSLSKGKIVCI